MVGLTSVFSSCNPCCHFSRLGVSYSRWCPGECENLCECCCETPAYAYLTQLAPLVLEANAPMPFTGPGVLSSGMERTDGLLTLPGPCVYLVRYQMHVGFDTPNAALFSLRLDGEDIPGTRQGAPAGVTTISAEAIIEVCDTATLGLFSTNGINLPASKAGIAVATMTVIGL